MPDNIQPEEEPVSTAWQRLVQGVLGVFLLMGTGFMGYYYWPPPTDKLHEQVQELSQQVDQLKQEQAMPAMVLNRYRNSICYIFGVYQVGFAQQRPALRARISGTGFVVAGGLLATHPHVAEPWYGCPATAVLFCKWATRPVGNVLAFF